MVKKQDKNWGMNVKRAADEAQERLMKTGTIFTGRNGEIVAAELISDEPEDGETPTKLPTYVLVVKRMESGAEQRMSLLKSNGKLMADLQKIGEQTGWHLAGHRIEGHFKEVTRKSDGTKVNVIDSIKLVAPGNGKAIEATA